MNLETFFDKFELFADAPDAVAKMRELVLQLAVRGKLVAQRPSDGQADSLIEALSASRKRRYKAKLSTLAPIDALGEGECWFDVPASWRWVRLGSVGDVVGGGTPRSTNPAYFADQGIPWLTPADLNGFASKRIHRGRRCITQLGLDNSSARLLPEGSVLFSSRAPIGYVAIAGCALATNQGFKSCVPFVPETNEFLYYYLKSAAPRIDREAPGTTFREVSGKAVSQIPVPLPPLAEQKRIAAKVDELMALCDRLEAQQQERETRHAALARASLARFAEAPTSANLEFLFHNAYAIPPADLRKSILALAVQGKLVPQDPRDEPASVLLGKIGKCRAALFGDRVIRTAKEREALLGNAPYQLPATWQWTSLGTITEVGTGSTPSRTDPAFWLGGTIPWVTSGSTSQSSITSGDAFVTQAAVEAHRLRLYPPGTLLVAMYGQGKTRGQVAVLEISATINQACAAICPLDGTPPMQGYLKLLLEKQYDEMRLLAAGGAQPNLNVQKIKELPVPLPPLAEQRRIVAKVEQLMKLVDKLEAQLASARTTATDLLAAAVTGMTSGRAG